MPAVLALFLSLALCSCCPCLLLLYRPEWVEQPESSRVQRKKELLLGKQNQIWLWWVYPCPPKKSWKLWGRHSFLKKKAEIMWFKQTVHITKKTKELDLLFVISQEWVWRCGHTPVAYRGPLSFGYKWADQRSFLSKDELLPMQTQSWDKSSIGKTVGRWVSLLRFCDETWGWD